MIKFFRKIRQKTLTENKFGKYLTYAIGEIILVVIGILIALQINDWNDSRKNTKLKNIYLNALTIDIQRDINNLNDWNKGNDNAEKEGLYLLDFLEKRVIEIDTLRIIESFLLCQYKPAVTIATSTYNDLINSGNIKIFKNLEFKNFLDEYYTSDNWSLKIDERITKTIWYDYRDKITEFIDPTIYKKIYQNINSPIKLKKLNLIGYDIEWEYIMKSDELLRQLRNVLAFRVVIRNDLLARKEKSINLLKEINDFQTQKKN